MTSDEERQRKRKRLNHLAKALQDAKYRQRKLPDKRYKKLKAILQEPDLDDLHSD